jgi:hypothetical protein
VPTEDDSWLKGKKERPWGAGLKMPVDHEFGDQHAKLKLSIVENT